MAQIKLSHLLAALEAGTFSKHAPAGYFPNGTPRGFGHIKAPGESDRARQNVVDNARITEDDPRWHPSHQDNPNWYPKRRGKLPGGRRLL